VAERHGVGPDAVALAAALARPWAGIVLMGGVSVAQLRANLAAARLTLDEADLAALAAIAVPPADYWSARSALPWT
jgi:aryl-alcohol dehydrogenase-like predicted oxidoreductase